MEIRRKISQNTFGDGYLIDLGVEKQAEIGLKEITIWDMRLRPEKRAEYMAIDPSQLLPSDPALRIVVEPELSKQQLFALHNKIAEVTAWWPIESDERPWEKLFDKFITMVLYKNDQPIGIAHAIPPNENGDVELKYIGLIKDEIGKGYGKYFSIFRMATLTKMFPESDIILGTTSFDNSPAKNQLALEYHKKMGFEIEGEPSVKTIMNTQEFYVLPFIKDRNNKNYWAAFNLSS